MLTKNQLKELFITYNFSPLKRYGENYLIDRNVKDKIIAEAKVDKNDTVLEIGPGMGALTFDLAKSGAKVYAVEKDKKAFQILEELVKDDFSNLKLFNEDILEFNLKDISKGKKLSVIGNLPYYITTPVIGYLISNRERIKDILIVIQREVANRIFASPGSKDRGSLSCFIQYYTKACYLHTISRFSFFPAPEVDSSLIKFEMLEKPPVKVADENLLFRIIRGAFNQRRKFILNSLSRKEVLDMSKEEITKLLAKASINLMARPEDLSLSDFAKISNSAPKPTTYRPRGSS